MNCTTKENLADFFDDSLEDREISENGEVWFEGECLKSNQNLSIKVSKCDYGYVEQFMMTS